MVTEWLVGKQKEAALGSFYNNEMSEKLLN